jgi:hypothetical protein
MILEHGRDHVTLPSGFAARIFTVATWRIAISRDGGNRPRTKRREI